ncbi:hypothetical protein [Amycolatopsis kentuckyensis]|uniref:hypothetical protein n=1 Tax=Amycolatopsis kentuckyensis TaxID=218823 RepID=UPI003568899E
MRTHLAIPVAATIAVTAVVITLAMLTPLGANVINFYAQLPSTIGGWGLDVWNGFLNGLDYLGHLVHFYDAPGNAGVQIAGIGGYEWRGTPGLFLCDGQC